ncbi:hypothetical protein BLNAU_5825 [Blattamonas nauphoetae]|uniref:Calx-beta domain-containing protein n=1 Tax=Blattamonas nauphoetae TaxID=2049346 RepID=A0ABQ9Y681_9EUKA|nr:hypothetical protein BLNAU_5825 [Blattamonas nauphoetae]
MCLRERESNAEWNERNERQVNRCRSRTLRRSSKYLRLACRVVVWETYFVIGIVVGGVVNQNISFSVPSGPSRLTRITASVFTHAEKPEIEISFEGRALKANSTYELILQSVAVEGETGDKKKIVLTTDVDAEFERFAVILYPTEEDETKRKGQGEFNSEYEMESIQHGSIPIHFETTDTSSSTPAERTCIEDCVSEQLDKDRTNLTHVLTATFENDALEIKFLFGNTLNTSCVVEVVGSDLVVSTEFNVTLNSTLWVIIRFWSLTKGKSEEVRIGWDGSLDLEPEYIVTSVKPLNEEDGDILLLERVSGVTGKRQPWFNVFVDSSSLQGS